MDSAAYISNLVRVLKNPPVGERRVPVGDGRCIGRLGAVPATGLYMALRGRYRRASWCSGDPGGTLEGCNSPVP